MKLIERYIFGKAGVASLMILGALTGVVWIIQALRGLDIIATKGQTILAYLSITTLIVPNLVLAIIPLALLISTIHTINTLNTNTELVVVSASGASNWTIAKPLLILALLCSLFAGIVGHVLSPLSLVKLRSLVTDMRADLVSVIIQEGTFNKVEDGLTFHIAERGAGGLLSGILIADDREAEISTILSANQGVVTRDKTGSFLKLRDGEIQQTNISDGNVTVIKYESYIFDLSSFSGKTNAGRVKAKERFTTELLYPDPNDKLYQQSPGRLQAELHQRFAEMLWPFAYVLMVLAFAGQARSNRQSYGASITAAAICVIVARGTGFSAAHALRSDPSAVYMVYALPLGCMLFGAWFVFTNRPVTLPKPVIDKSDIVTEAISRRIKQLHAGYINFRRKRAGISA